jgi:hypothetical protein
MSHPERQARISETLELLGRLAPADLQTNRDELLFRAGEASARGELAGSSLRRLAWPAIAATLALVAAGLGYSMANREPEIQIVYVERPGSVGSAHQPPGPAVNDSTSALDDRALPAPPDSTQARFTHGLGARSDLIHPQDWAALSDAFASQLRLQHGSNESLATDLRQGDAPALDDTPRPQPRTYLELRDALHAM